MSEEYIPMSDVQSFTPNQKKSLTFNSIAYRAKSNAKNSITPSGLVQRID